MGEIAKWLVQVSWTDLAVGAMAGLAAAALLAVLVMSLTHSDRDGRSDEVPQEQQRLLLFCGDARVLADLAVQRHMSDAAFSQRFQSQPCCQALSPHFSEQFREYLAQPGQQKNRSGLASACRQECERLERQWRVR